MFVPAGTYIFTSGTSLTMPGDVILAGTGHGSQLQWDQTVVSPLFKAPSTSNVQYNEIRDLRITQTNASAGGTAIEASYFQFSRIERVLIDGSAARPSVGVSYNVAGTHYNVLRDCIIFVDGSSPVSGTSFNAIGVRYDNVATSNVCDNCRILISGSDATQVGIYVNAYLIELNHPDIETFAGTAIYQGTGATANRPTVIVAPYIEPSTGNGTPIVQATSQQAPAMGSSRYTIVKPSLTAVTSSTSLTADPHLTTTLLLSRTYSFDMMLIMDGDGNSAGGFSFSFDIPAGATITYGVIGLVSTVTGAFSGNAALKASASPSTTNLGLNTVGSPTIAVTRGIVQMGTVSSTFDLKWAQAGSSTFPTTLYAGSTMTIEQIG